ncbi:MAG: orotidine-5'-phosphate decarboxylase [Chitinophagales bacterium]|nr:orotidine-5'-phosphate decarboxylase [Chitinophagales bacterium]
MTYHQLVEQIQTKKSCLCIGLDTDLDKIPPHLLQYNNPILEFNKAIIDATHDLCVAYKPNIAFYESYGAKGWQALATTAQYIPNNLFKIADAKRGDIGNTAQQYAKAFFETMNFDAITLSPYMGLDTIAPFLAYKNKWVIVLALTSNNGAKDFQFVEENGIPLYQTVIQKSLAIGTKENTMFVVGATKEDYFKTIRKICPDNFLLVPGIGAQGGDLQAVIANGKTKDVGLLINATRSIIYASNGKDFAEKAREAALQLKNEMEVLLF